MTRSLAETLKAKLADLEARRSGDGTSITDPQTVDDRVVPQHDIPLAALDDVSPIKTVRMVAVGSIRIDPKQPRQYLPAAIRQLAVHGGQDALEALARLFAAADAQELEAIGYLDGIAELARSIESVGLLQPILVQAISSDPVMPMYQIIDGERRYWAVMYRYFRTDVDQAITGQIPIIVNPTSVGGDEAQRAQWAANLYHEAISIVDFAEAVWRIREDFLVRLERDRTQYLEQLGPNADELSSNDAAIQLTISEMVRLTGRSVQRRNLYRYLSISERLCPEAKALARAYNLGLRALSTLSRWQVSQQMEAIKKMIPLPEANTEVSNRLEPRTKATGGRPSSLRRGINGCVSLIGVLQQLNEHNLSRNAGDDLRVLLSELDRAAVEVERTRRLLSSQIQTKL